MKREIAFGNPPRTVSKFGLGTIGWGTKTVGDELEMLYDVYREAGGNFFDTAHIYAAWLPKGDGASERAVGEIVRRRGDSKNVIIASKGGHPRVDRWYEKSEAYLSAKRIAEDLRDSLDRLGVDVIDLYYLHRDDPCVPASEIVETLNELIRSGQVLAIGVSNWTTARIDEANAFAAKSGLVGFSISQPKFSLAIANPSSDKTVPAFDAGELKWHEANGFPVAAYTPTAGGFFATDGKKGSGGFMNVESARRLAVAKEIASMHRVSPNQIALAWLLHQAFPVVPLLGTEDVEHLREALDSERLRLSKDDMKRLNGESR